MGSAVSVSLHGTPMSLQMPLNSGRRTVTMELKVLAFAGAGLLYLAVPLAGLGAGSHVSTRACGVQRGSKSRLSFLTPQ